MPAYILTGAPGAGKTAALRHLETDGYAVVEEAATERTRSSSSGSTSRPTATSGSGSSTCPLARWPTGGPRRGDRAGPPR